MKNTCLFFAHLIYNFYYPIYRGRSDRSDKGGILFINSEVIEVIAKNDRKHQQTKGAITSEAINKKLQTKNMLSLLRVLSLQNG